MDDLIAKREAELNDPDHHASTTFQDHTGCGTLRGPKHSNAMSIFSLTDPFTLEQLKEAYRRLALTCHPDKAGGDAKKFSQIGKSFKLLRPLVQKEQQTLDEMLMERDSALQVPQTDIKDFGKAFENRHVNEHLSGHDEWFKQEVVAEARAPEKIKFKDFDREFERCNKAKAMAIVRHTVSYLPSSHMACTDLTEKDGQEFSGNGYSDLKSAYGRSILN